MPDLLALAHEVRLRWCGPEVEVEGIVSVKTGGCPEDCHFCSQSGLFTSPVRSVWLDGRRTDWDARTTNRGLEVTVEAGRGDHELVVEAR